MKLEPIDTSTTEGKIQVMRLASEGRRLVYCLDGCWIEHYGPTGASWNWAEFTYAIIAEPVGPKEAWTVVADGNVLFASHETAAISIARRHGGTVVRYVRADD